MHDLISVRGAERCVDGQGVAAPAVLLGPQPEDREAHCNLFLRTFVLKTFLSLVFGT